jgi:hypothetical protein
MVAGSLGVGLAYPLDTLKVKAQVYAGAGGSMGAVALATRVINEEGLGGFYSGVVPTMIGQALIKGVLFFAYESLKVMLQQAPGSDLTLDQLAIAAAASGRHTTSRRH